MRGWRRGSSVILASIPSPSSGVWHSGRSRSAPTRCASSSASSSRSWSATGGCEARGGRPGVDRRRSRPGRCRSAWSARGSTTSITDPELYCGSHGQGTVARSRSGTAASASGAAIAGGALGAYIGCRRHDVAFAAVRRRARARHRRSPRRSAGGATTSTRSCSAGRRRCRGALEIDAGAPPDAATAGATFHPTFLYESLWDIGVALLVIWADRRWRLGHGRAFALYVALYTVGRFWIEALRIDDAHQFLGLRLNDWTSIVVFVARGGVLRAAGATRTTPSAAPTLRTTRRRASRNVPWRRDRRLQSRPAAARDPPHPPRRHRRLAAAGGLRRDGRAGHQRRADHRRRRRPRAARARRRRSPGWPACSPARSRWRSASGRRCARSGADPRPRSTRSSASWCAGPSAEEAELAGLYRSRGLSRDLARQVARELSRTPRWPGASTCARSWASTPTTCPRRTSPASSSLASFAVGALVPLLPYLLGVHPPVAVAGARRRRAGRARRGVARFTDRPAWRGAAGSSRWAPLRPRSPTAWEARLAWVFRNARVTSPARHDQHRADVVPLRNPFRDDGTDV